MSNLIAPTEQLWFLNCLVSFPVSHGDGADGISMMEVLAGFGDSPPLHIHRTEDELFHVLEGEIRLHVDGEDRAVRAGETVLAPKGVPHTYRIESATARMLVVTTSGDFERFVRAMSRPAERADLPIADGPPTPEQERRLTEVAAANRIDLIGPPLG